MAGWCIGPSGVEASSGAVVSQPMSLGIDANILGPVGGYWSGPVSAVANLGSSVWAVAIKKGSITPSLIFSPLSLALHWVLGGRSVCLDWLDWSWVVMEVTCSLSMTRYCAGTCYFSIGRLGLHSP